MNEICAYSTLNKNGKPIADAHCEECDKDYQSCVIYDFQEDFPITPRDTKYISSLIDNPPPNHSETQKRISKTF